MPFEAGSPLAADKSKIKVPYLSIDIRVYSNDTLGVMEVIVWKIPFV